MKKRQLTRSPHLCLKLPTALLPARSERVDDPRRSLERKRTRRERVEKQARSLKRRRRGRSHPPLRVPKFRVPHRHLPPHQHHHHHHHLFRPNIYYILVCDDILFDHPWIKMSTQHPMAWIPHASLKFLSKTLSG